MEILATAADLFGLSASSQEVGGTARALRPFRAITGLTSADCQHHLRTTLPPLRSFHASGEDTLLRPRSCADQAFYTKQATDNRGQSN